MNETKSDGISSRVHDELAAGEEVPDGTATGDRRARLARVGRRMRANWQRFATTCAVEMAAPTAPSILCRAACALRTC
ncbi:hypothetical protein [Breoghania sp.]|uniref:hypothetical protein n=1 Tax=Breoghania sp. TaxID=2065378 RepID=UPI002637EDEF|nr:hypothetical protein [Breoghania sp.]MDJ0929547.1 hypothetical protein [Breoghania sp.]